jgi:predicted phage terminase large subunit-like protein
LFPEEHIERWRHLDGDLPEWQRIVVAVDPSGSGDTDNVDNDAIGILVVGLGTDGNCYVLEDCTVKAGPGTWGNIATTAFDRHRADVIVAETNFGGAMVQTVIQAARQRTPFKAVTASRGKVVRAEPFSSLYEQGKIRHVGYFRELEDELAGFSTLGYTGHGSPNRADALIWGLTELFPGMVNPRKQTKPEPIERLASAAAWMS